MLDATDSSDPEDDTITYRWTQTSGPEVVLSSASAANPTFTAPDTLEDTTLRFQLVVNDGIFDSSPDTVRIEEDDSKGEMTIRAVDQGSGEFLTGAVFEITPNPFTLEGSLTVHDGDGSDSDPTDGVILLDDVEFSTYSVEERNVPDGYARIVQSVTISVHATQQSPVVDIENKQLATPIVEPIDIPSPDLTSAQFNAFTITNGAAVGGTPIATVNDLPAALLVSSEGQIAAPPLPITFATAAPQTFTTQQLLDLFSIPTYPALEPDLARNNVYVSPAILVDHEGLNSQFLMTPLLEQVFPDMTLMLRQDVAVPSGNVTIKQVEMTFSDAGAGSDVAFSFSLTETVPPDTITPPAEVIGKSVLYMTTDYVGDFGISSFSEEEAFDSPPKVTILVDKDAGVKLLNDGCPDLVLFMFNELTEQWEQVRQAVRDPAIDSGESCGYIVEPDHFSKFAVGGVKLATDFVVPPSKGHKGGGGSSPVILQSDTSTTKSVLPGSDIGATFEVGSSSINVSFKHVSSGGKVKVSELSISSMPGLFTSITAEGATLVDADGIRYATIGNMYDVDSSDVKFT
ncbi:MAG TPA: SpaA isopeptide-forming pilin-related protein, partial [Nitrososphaera sp.]|nr:SpaA isopeptide-forming pilin-related protein [Nitrososphaera sp.]